MKNFTEKELAKEETKLASPPPSPTRSRRTSTK